MTNPAGRNELRPYEVTGTQSSELKHQTSRRTRIVCTIGPACWQPDMLRQMMLAGMNVARINFSHAEYETTARVIADLRRLSAELDHNLAILADLQGPRIRMGAIPEPGVTLIPSAEFTLYADPATQPTQSGAAVDYPALPEDVKAGDTILIDDGLLQLRVLDTAPGQVHTEVVSGGLLGSHKGINVPGVTLSAPTITDKDKADLAFALDHDVDAIALSFVRSPDDVAELRRLIAAHGVARPLVISKIEKHEAARRDNFAAILAASDGIMVARGDLGVEMAAEELPILQKWMIKLTRAEGKPVITATQMLDSMMRNPRPTRAEATDVANAIFDGTDATMLSGESAVGLYPLLAVQTMARIAARAEQDYLTTPGAHTLDAASTADCTQNDLISQAVSHTIVETAMQLQAKAIVTLTRSGYTARQVAKYRPAIPVLAITSLPPTYRQLAFTWGVTPCLVPSFTTIDEMLIATEHEAVAAGVAQAGDTIVISAGLPLNTPGLTNMLKVQVVGEQE
jgi:pyruvate kinase